MSDYYDLFLTVELPQDLPEPAMRELRWLLGEAEAPTPLTSADWETWGYPWQVFDGGVPSHAFDGVDSSSLLRTEQTYADGSTPWALTVRTCVHEDEFGIVMEVVAWVLELASTRGWVGFLRYTGSDAVQHLLRHEDGFDVVDVRASGRPDRVAFG
ncbi:hypothetical protein ACGFYY_01315 [Streptomyces sp. NPDC048331]|uniref:hypothetical protein n=1 Tax=Streptomyces sp. NPDC048331 TaxID=3365534 RepID=UPI0037203070